MKWAVNGVYDHKQCAYLNGALIDYYNRMRTVINEAD